MELVKKFKLAKYVKKKNCVVFWEIYTADKNFTRPPVATVATNSKSDLHSQCCVQWWKQAPIVHYSTVFILKTSHLAFKQGVKLKGSWTMRAH